MTSFDLRAFYDDLWIKRVITNPDKLPVSELLAVRKEEGDEFEESRWTNRDLIPTPKDRQTWTAISYFGYWAVAGMGIPTWSMGSSALAYGLNCKLALVAMAVGWLLVGILCCAIGAIGQKWRIGYTVTSRAAFGFYGCYLPIAIKSFVACIWQGSHFYYIGQGFVGAFGALSPSCITGDLGQTFSDWSPLTKIELIGVMVALVLFCLVMLTPPEKMQTMVHISFVLQCGSFFGILGWAVHANGGKLGPLWDKPSSTETGFNPAWGVFFMITSIMGSNSGILGQSDWTRYAKTRFAPNWSQLISAPITGFCTAAMGIFASAAMEPVLGIIYWNPVALLPALLVHYDFSPAARGAVFFASFGIISGQLWQAVLLTACSTGMDIAGFWPKYINIRRGSYIMSIIGILCQPWKLLSTSGVFLTVISGFAVFIGPLVGCAVADYFFVRKQKYRMPDLYQNDESSIYNYKWGINWRGMFSIAVGSLPTLPGLICSGGGYPMPSGYEKLYNLTYLFGIVTTMVVHYLINLVFPPAGLGEEAPYTDKVYDEYEGIELDVSGDSSSDTKAIGHVKVKAVNDV